MRLCLIYRCARKPRLRPMLGSVAISDSGSPPVLPGDAKQIEVILRARRHAAARRELDRVANVEGERERSAEAPVLPEVVVELRLEPPAVGAEAHGPLAVVLTPRRGYLQ